MRIVIYWAINLLLFVFMYGTNPFIPFIIWIVIMMCIWIYEGYGYNNYIQEKYPEEYAAVTGRKKTLKAHFKLSKSTKDQELKINQQRIKQVIVSIIIWFILAPVVLILGAIN